ncbi:metal-dependent hydrolase [Thermosyntropha sp.]|uniref:metal-dependent hydrolase n=1 Tax=Thermosyntropha sp. TaxID=2740820 RepID=UPI0025D4A978|nr:metal-dependent hydrolase [Thermosyntropha sp.]MBO8159604.1 metal-dependent hydrolase [Thermosyntropha sp.]
MMGRTHFVTGLALGSFISWPAAFAAGIAALLPDIDSCQSTIGRLVRPVSYVIQKTVGHRNLFHSVWILIVIHFFCTFLPHDILLGVLIGYLSHILLDILNPAGVRVFWPIPINLALPLVRTGSLIEYLVILPTGILILIGNLGI